MCKLLNSKKKTLCMIMMILFMCIWRVKSMYYILLLSQMSKLQFCSESNYAAIFQLSSLLVRFFFWASDWEFFFWKLGKKEDILDWEWGLYSASGDREKRPWDTMFQFERASTKRKYQVWIPVYVSDCMIFIM